MSLKPPIDNSIKMLKQCRSKDLSIGLESIRLTANLKKVTEKCVVVNVLKYFNPTV